MIAAAVSAIGILHTVKPDIPLAAIPDRESGTRVPIARLTDGPRVD